MMKTNLDEMQEQTLLKIEHNGCWLAFWGLLAAMGIQLLLGMGGKALLGEWIVFMGMCVYLLVACLRQGIWDRRMKANGKTNLVASAVAAVTIGIFFAILLKDTEMDLIVYLMICLIPAIVVFALCMLLLTLTMAVYKKRRAKLDQE